MMEDWEYCREMLPKVSRTFALNISVLEGDLHRSILIAYLFCRIVDTVEDAARLDPVHAQSLYTTEDYRQDSAHWTDPAYYRNNTVRQTRDMVERERYAEEGSGVDLFELQSPYPYTTSQEHYQAWLTAANGGTEHTLGSLPDWNGRWDIDEAWLGGDDIQVSTIVAALTPPYQEYFVQQVKAESEGL